jgi:hypothetical protein
MEIKEIKKRVELDLMGRRNVFGIGTIFRDGNYFIEISVKDVTTQVETENYLRQRYPQYNFIKVIIRDQTKIQ